MPNDLATGGRNMLRPGYPLPDSYQRGLNYVQDPQYAQPLPDMPNVAPFNAFLRRHPTAAQFLPSGETLSRGYEALTGGGPGPSPVEAAPSGGGVSVAPKNVPAPERRSQGEMMNTGRAQALRQAWRLGMDLAPEAETLLHDFADSSEGRAYAEHLLRNPGDAQMADQAKAAIVQWARGRGAGRVEFGQGGGAG